MSADFRSTQTKALMLEALRDPAKEKAEDKLRLLLCFYLTVADNAIPKDDLVEYERALKETGVDMGPWEYAKKLRDITRMSSLGSAPTQSSASTPGGELLRGFSSISNRVSFCPLLLHPDSDLSLQILAHRSAA